MSDVVFIRAGSSFARSPVIDGWLEEEEVVKLYRRWKVDWPIDSFQGGVTGITLSHVREVGFRPLSHTFGPKFATRLLEIANNEDEM